MRAAGLAQNVRVFDIATLDAYETSDGTEIPAVIERDGGLGCDVAGRRLIPRRQDAWDAILDVLVELDASHPAAFARLMRACTALSNSRREIDGLDALLTGAEQAMFELADDRERRREGLGFASAAQARAFLESSRRLRLDAPAPCSADRGAQVQAPAGVDAPAPAPVDAVDAAAAGTETAAVIDLLSEAGLLAAAPRGLLAAPSGPASARDRIHAQLRAAVEHDPAAGATRQAELAVLANAIVAGCTIEARPFTPQEASDAVLATCSLGLEYWPARWGDAAPTSEDFLVRHDLVTVFQVGWTVLHDEVCVPAVTRLLEALGTLPARDPQTQADLAALRDTLTRHLRAGTAWQARDALDVLASLDQLAWVTLLGLIAECPVALATIEVAGAPRARRVDPSAFTFVSSRAQIDAVGAYLATLPDALGA